MIDVFHNDTDSLLVHVYIMNCNGNTTNIYQYLLICNEQHYKCRYIIFTPRATFLV